VERATGSTTAYWWRGPPAALQPTRGEGQLSTKTPDRYWCTLALLLWRGPGTGSVPKFFSMVRCYCGKGHRYCVEGHRQHYSVPAACRSSSQWSGVTVHTVLLLWRALQRTGSVPKFFSMVRCYCVAALQRTGSVPKFFSMVRCSSLARGSMREVDPRPPPPPRPEPRWGGMRA
jgi:hypothetical protein